MFEVAERLRNIKVSASAAMTRKVRELRAQGVKIVGLSSGEPDFKSPANATRRALGASRRSSTAAASGPVGAGAGSRPSTGPAWPGASSWRWRRRRPRSR